MLIYILEISISIYFLLISFLPGCIKQRLIFAWLVSLIFSQRRSRLSDRGRDWHRLEKAASYDPLLFWSWSSLFKHPTFLFNLQQCVLLRCRLRGGKAFWFFIGPSFNVFSGNYCNTSCGNVNTDRSSLVLHKSIVHEYKYHDSFSLVLNIQMMLGKAYYCSVDSEAVCFLSCSLW